jgi:hypothetical protein
MRVGAADIARCVPAEADMARGIGWIELAIVNVPESEGWTWRGWMRDLPHIRSLDCPGSKVIAIDYDSGIGPGFMAFGGFSRPTHRKGRSNSFLANCFVIGRSVRRRFITDSIGAPPRAFGAGFARVNETFIPQKNAFESGRPTAKCSVRRSTAFDHCSAHDCM